MTTTTLTAAQITAIAEGMLSRDTDYAMVANAIIANPDARNCEHWNDREIVALAADCGIGALDRDDDVTFERIADEYARLADEYAANNAE